MRQIFTAKGSVAIDTSVEWTLGGTVWPELRSECDKLSGSVPGGVLEPGQN
jgi:hypothetical protein